MLVIGLNQTIDRTLRLPALTAGHVLRATDVTVTAGGKAVNVCRAATTLRSPARLVGPFPGTLGAYARRLLAGEGLDVTPIDASGEIRGTTIVLEDSGQATVVNEPGPPLDGEGWAAIIDTVRSSLERDEVVSISGSVPPGTPDHAHRTLIDLVHDAGGYVAVDATGDRLRHSLDAGADLVSPNLSEAEAVLGGAGDEAVDPDAAGVVERATAAASALRTAGAAAALVSAGRHGVAVAGATSTAWIAAPEVDVANPIGAGDSLLAATLVSLERGRPLVTAACDGVAYAAASVAHPIGGYADPDLVTRLRQQVSAA